MPGIGQIGGRLQPDARALQPGARRAKAVAARLVVAEVQVQQRQVPVAEVADVCSGISILARAECAAQGQIVAAEAEDRVGLAPFDQPLGSRVDRHADFDLARAAGQVPGAQAQQVNAVGPGGRVERRDRNVAAHIHRAQIGLAERAPGRLVHAVAIAGCRLQPVARQLQVGDPGGQHRGRGNDRRGQPGDLRREAAGEGKLGRRRVERVAHAHGLRGSGAEAVGIDGGDADLDRARRSGREAQAAGGIERGRCPVGQAQAGAAHLRANTGDGAEAVGAHRGDHHLARQYRRARRELDQQLRRVGFCVGHHAQHEAGGGRALAVAHRGEHREVADLAGAGRPEQLAAGGVVAGALRQVAEADRERRRLRRAVGVTEPDRAWRSAGTLDHRQAEALAHEQGVAGGDDLGRAVQVQHAHLHRAADGGGAVAGAEVEAVGPAVAVGVVDRVGVRRPLEAAARGVEIDSGRGVGVVDQGEPDRIVIAIDGADGEGQGLAFGHELQRQGQQDRRLVEVGDLDLDFAAEAGAAVAGAQLEQVAAGCGSVAALRGKEAGRPAQLELGLAAAAGRGHSGHARRHALDRPVEAVQIAVDGGEVQRQRRALLRLDDDAGVGERVADQGAASGAHGKQRRRGIGGAHDDAQVAHRGVGLGRVQRVERIAGVGRGQTGIGHRQTEVEVAAQVGVRRPHERGVAVAGIGLDARPCGQAGGGVAQRILVEIADDDGHAQLGAGHSDDLARQRDDRRLARAPDAEHEALGRRQRLAGIAVAVVLRDDRDRVVAAGVGAGGEADDAGLPAGGVALLDVAGESRQALHRDGDRVAVRIAGVDRRLQDGAFVDEGVGNVADLRRAVGVGDDDRQHDLAGERRAGAVAVVGGRDGDGIGAGLGGARRPDDLQRLGIEAGACRQAGDGVADRGARALAPDRGPGRGRQRVEADLGLEAGVVGVEGEDADPQRLAFERPPGLHRVEDRRGVGVADIERQLARQARRDRVAAVGRREGRAQAQRNLERAGLRVARQPAQPAGAFIERGAAGQPGRRPAQLDAAAVGLLQAAGDAAGQLQVEALALAQHLGVERREHRPGMALGNVEVEAALHLLLAVAGDDDDVAVAAGLVVAGGPGQEAAGGVEARAGR